MVRVFERVEATYDIDIDWPRLLPNIKTLIGYLLSGMSLKILTPNFRACLSTMSLGILVSYYGIATYHAKAC